MADRGHLGYVPKKCGRSVKQVKLLERKRTLVVYAYEGSVDTLRSFNEGSSFLLKGEKNKKTLDSKKRVNDNVHFERLNENKTEP